MQADLGRCRVDAGDGGFAPWLMWRRCTYGIRAVGTVLVRVALLYGTVLVLRLYLKRAGFRVFCRLPFACLHFALCTLHFSLHLEYSSDYM